VLAATGCKAKEKDPSTTEVMKITITSTPVPTEEPESVHPDAVISNGGITMINEYRKNDPVESEEDQEASENTGTGDEIGE
jgi:hypothetical protein